MLQFHLSKVLAKDMAMHIQGSATTNTAAAQPGALQWYAHRVTVNRRKCVLLMEPQSRYCMVFCGLTKPDFADFPSLFRDRLWREVLSICKLDDKQSDELRALVHLLSEAAVFAPGHDRSVQAHINDVSWHLEDQANASNSLPLEPHEAFAFGSFANGLIRKRKGEKDYFHPREVFRDFWLGLLQELNADDGVGPVLASLQSDERPIPDNVLPFRRK